MDWKIILFQIQYFLVSLPNYGYNTSYIDFKKEN